MRRHLREKQPLYFSNIGDHLVGQVKYAYSDGRTAVTAFSPEEPQLLQEGWWYQRKSLTSDYTVGSHPSPRRLSSFVDAVEHFVIYALIPEKGPGYQSRALEGNKLRLSLLEKVLREGEENPINDLLRRGWLIIALEYKGELSQAGELLNRDAIFVLGHPEAQAAAFMLDWEDYRPIYLPGSPKELFQGAL